MARLRITTFGTDCEGIRLLGDPSHPEPEYVRLDLPGATVVVTRVVASDPNRPEYWVHLDVLRPERSAAIPEGQVRGRVVDARADRVGEHAGDTHDAVVRPLDEYRRVRRVIDALTGDDAQTNLTRDLLAAELNVAAEELAESVSGLLDSPELYHLAVRVRPEWGNDR